MSYWDTSALLKLYVREAHSRRFETLAAGFTIVRTSELARFELRRALVRKESERTLPRGQSKLIYEMFVRHCEHGLVQLVPVALADLEEVFRGVLTTCYSANPPLFIRTYDALHLATAMHAAASPIVCADTRMREAARLLGLLLAP